MEIKSPVTGSYKTTFIENIKVSDICALYKEELNTSVSRLFNNIENVSIIQCDDTKYKFYYPMSVFGDERLYNDLQINLPLLYNSPYYSPWKWEYDVALKYINKKDTVFEIGCGRGYFLKKLKNLGHSAIAGLELNALSVNEVVNEGLNVKLQTIEDYSQNVYEKFSIVCSFQVLEHICEVKSFIDSSLKVLKPKGKLIISVPYSKPYLFGSDKMNTLNLPPHHMGLWNEVVFENLTKFFKINVVDIVIESLPISGYDFDRYFDINKDSKYPINYPFKSLFDRIYKVYLRRNRSSISGKNIVAVFEKK